MSKGRGLTPPRTRANAHIQTAKRDSARGPKRRQPRQTPYRSPQSQSESDYSYSYENEQDGQVSEHAHAQASAHNLANAGEPSSHVVPIHTHAPTEFDPEYNPLIGASTLYSPENLHVRIFEWLNTTFPHRENRLVNGAQGGVGTGYFGWCFSGSTHLITSHRISLLHPPTVPHEVQSEHELRIDEHIPEDSDLVLVELGINDLVELDVMESYETLVRGLLELPSRPAVINIEWVLL